MRHGHDLDVIDGKILQILQRKGRIKRSELAGLVGLSVPSVSERLKRLEQDKIIDSYRVILNPEKIGFDVAAFINVTVDSSEHYQHFLDRVVEVDEIIECHAITGDGTHLLKVRAKNTSELERLLSKIQSWQGVTRTTTRVILSSPKETTFLPVNMGQK